MLERRHGVLDLLLPALGPPYEALAGSLSRDDERLALGPGLVEQLVGLRPGRGHGLGRLGRRLLGEAASRVEGAADLVAGRPLELVAQGPDAVDEALRVLLRPRPDLVCLGQRPL